MVMVNHSACCGCLGGCTAAGCLPGVGGSAGLTEPVDMVVVNMVVVVVFPLGAQKSRLQIFLNNEALFNRAITCKHQHGGGMSRAV